MPEVSRDLEMFGRKKLSISVTTIMRRRSFQVVYEGTDSPFITPIEQREGEKVVLRRKFFSEGRKRAKNANCGEREFAGVRQSSCASIQEKSDGIGVLRSANTAHAAIRFKHDLPGFVHAERAP
jgi:hypothetical protein